MPVFAQAETAAAVDHVKNCPFCGSNENLSEERNNGGPRGFRRSFWWERICLTCRARTIGDTEIEAVVAWNRRP